LYAGNTGHGSIMTTTVLLLDLDGSFFDQCEAAGVPHLFGTSTGQAQALRDKNCKISPGALLDVESGQEIACRRLSKMLHLRWPSSSVRSDGANEVRATFLSAAAFAVPFNFVVSPPHATQSLPRLLRASGGHCLFNSQSRAAHALLNTISLPHRTDGSPPTS
jgi:hypothetical protein